MKYIEVTGVRGDIPVFTYTELLSDTQVYYEEFPDMAPHETVNVVTLPTDSPLYGWWEAFCQSERNGTISYFYNYGELDCIDIRSYEEK